MWDRRGLSANGVRFVVRVLGSFDLITAFPIWLEHTSSKITETGSVIQRLVSYFPNLGKGRDGIERYVVMLNGKNTVIGIKKDLNVKKPIKK